MENDRKELFWISSSKKDLCNFPDDVKQVMGFALDVAQCGGKHRDAKPLKGFSGAGVLEVVEDFEKGDGGIKYIPSAPLPSGLILTPLKNTAKINLFVSGNNNLRGKCYEK